MPTSTTDDAAADAGRCDNRARYDAFMEVVRARSTTRRFEPSYVVPDDHYGMILEAARHAPSGANAQPWFYIVVRERAVKKRIADYFVAEQRARAKLKMKFPTPNYRGLETAPGMIVVNDGSDRDRMYRQNAERILLQSVAASTMSAHLAAAALGYNLWWMTAIGQEVAQRNIKPLLGIPDELSVIDIMCFGPPAKPPYRRWKKQLAEIMSWDRYDADNHLSDEDIDRWVRDKRHQAIYRDAANVD